VAFFKGECYSKLRFSRERERERERVCEVRARCEVKICLKSLNEYIEGLLTRIVHFEVDDW
jgi:hypothetical protein